MADFDQQRELQASGDIFMDPPLPRIPKAPKKKKKKKKSTTTESSSSERSSVKPRGAGTPFSSAFEDAGETQSQFRCSTNVT